LHVEVPLSVVLFGTEIPLGRLVDELPASDVKIAHAAPVADTGPPRWLQLTFDGPRL
jgi:hypothetical protein